MNRVLVALSGALALAGAVPSAAQALTLTFNGANCNGGIDCGNGRSIDNTYGDIAGQLDVVYSPDISGAGTNLYYWSTNYGGLNGVAYGAAGKTVEIFLKPLAGYQITLAGFDLGAYNLNRGSQMTLRGGDGSLISSTGSIVVPVSGGLNVAVGQTRTDGFRIQWGPDGYDVGIDNISFEVSAIPGGAVPEPATWAMMILGFGATGAMMRSRRRTALA